MQYIKAKFPNSTRSYVYRTEDNVKAGDTVVNAKGAKLTVTDESVNMKWVETYGADKMAVVKKYEAPENGTLSSVSLNTQATNVLSYLEVSGTDAVMSAFQRIIRYTERITVVTLKSRKPMSGTEK